MSLPRRARTLAALSSTVILLAAVAGPSVPSPAFGVQKSETELQIEFGVKVATKGSWLEAAFRFERAIKLGANTARAWIPERNGAGRGWIPARRTRRFAAAAR